MNEIKIKGQIFKVGEIVEIIASPYSGNKGVGDKIIIDKIVNDNLFEAVYKGVGISVLFEWVKKID